MKGAKEDAFVRLSPAHRDELERASAIAPDVIAERGYQTLGPRDAEKLAAHGIQVHGRTHFPGLFVPMFRATGEPISAQFKPAKTVMIKGRSVKYLSPRGYGHLDVHPRNHARIRNISVPLWITEGIKKSDSLATRGCCVVALTGVYHWRAKLGTLGDWEDVPIKGREVVLCFDADARWNMNVARAMIRLGRWCRSKGAKVVRYVIVPDKVNGRSTKGADDYFAAGGTLEELMAIATTAEPETETADDTFSDSRLAETIADEVLADRFLWCKALGWMRWTGERWTAVSEETVGEAIRQYVLRRFEEAVMAKQKTATNGWRSMLSVGRQRAVLTLTRGIVERTAEVFDAEPDLLNTPSGVIDLRTGDRLQHDPDLLMTKITRGSYRPGYTHPDWGQALRALPDDTRDWFQVRVGQAITGHPTPDGVIVVCQGGGENGKSAVTTDGIVPALGDYAAPASAKLVSSSNNEHSTERADLRGQRFLVAEELTEDRALNITAIKQITDVSVIKARYVYRDNFTFTASHSLFITTNYVPVVNETDHGTWRRLALLVFPFTFRKAGEPLTAATDRRGDPGLKARIRGGKLGQHDAIATWAVDGARRWYASGSSPLPRTVDADTRNWRKQADRILGFWDECLIADPSACIATTDLQQGFTGWMQKNGHNAWSKELVGSRFKAHVETKRHGVVETRPRRLDKMHLSRPAGGMLTDLPDRPYVYVGVRFRAPSEIGEQTDQDSDQSERSDGSRTCSEGDCGGDLHTRSDHSDQGSERTEGEACCEGGPLALRCRLCRRSPTYWLEDHDGVRIPSEV